MYYIDLLNYSYVTGDSKPFLRASDKGCVGCAGLAGYARRINARNGGLKGDFKDRLVDVKEIYRTESGGLGGSALVRSGNYQERVSPGATPVPQVAFPERRELGDVRDADHRMKVSEVRRPMPAVGAPEIVAWS